MRWMDDVKSLTDLSINDFSDLYDLVKDRKKWNSLVNNIVKINV